MKGFYVAMFLFLFVSCNQFDWKEQDDRIEPIKNKMIGVTIDALEGKSSIDSPYLHNKFRLILENFDDYKIEYSHKGNPISLVKIESWKEEEYVGIREDKKTKYKGRSISINDTLYFSKSIFYNENVILYDLTLSRYKAIDGTTQVNYLRTIINVKLLKRVKSCSLY